jgi:RND family efflux transporter MFP subunit
MNSENVHIKRAKSPTKMILGAIAILAVIVIVILVIKHGFGEDHPPANTAVPKVAVAKVERATVSQEVFIPAEFRAYVQVDLHAKVSGYVKDMNVDFGDRVKAGQLLATLEIPELQADLSNAEAAEQRAVADYTDEHLAYTRLLAVNTNHPGLVAQQDVDAAESKDLATKATVAATQADIVKYQAWVAYSHITAPFDGVITMRYADPGAFIEAGTAGTAAKSLLQISDNYLLRLDFPVSVEYVPDIHVGDTVAVQVETLGNESFNGVITRFTDLVDEDTRTMMTEIQVTNQNLELIPGMYTQVVLKVNRHPNALVVPTEAVVSTKSPSVYVVNQDHNLEERPVKLGVEMPNKYEVLSGLQEGELVVIGNHGAIKEGQTVDPQLTAPLSMNNN